MNRSSLEQSELYPHRRRTLRHCQGPECSLEFEPQVWNQKYHTIGCKRSAENERKRGFSDNHFSNGRMAQLKSSSIESLDDLDLDSEEQLEFLRRENRRLGNLAEKHKRNKAELVDSLYRAAYDALSSLDVPVVKPPKKRVMGKGDEEVANPMLSDLQMGKITASYNTEVCRERIELFGEKIAKITDIQRSDHPVKNAHVYALGDIVEGEDIFPGQCVDDITEALTKDGWKTIHDMSPEDEILIFDSETGEAKWEVPSALNIYDYDGDLVQIRTRAIDKLVTPNHRCYVASVRGNPFKVIEAGDIKLSENSSGYVFKTAADGGTWEGEFYFPPIWPTDKTPGTWMENCDDNDMASFVGWFISEGFARYGEVAIAQDRQANPDKWEEISSLLSRFVKSIPGKKGEAAHFSFNDNGFIINSSTLSQWCLEHFGHLAENKKLPIWAKNWPKEQLGVLLDSMMRGDGHYGIENRVGTPMVYATNSDKLADDVQEICIKLGYSAWVGPRTKTYSKIGSWEGWGSRKNVHILKHRNDRYASRKEDVAYKGKVWCPTVSTGFWFMRRNGKACVTGNSFLIDSSLYKQIVSGVEVVADFLRRMLSEFETVHFVGVIGNHGALSSARRGHYNSYNPETNMDRLLYKFVSMLFADEKRITFNIPDGHGESSFYAVDHIGNYGTLLMHGDQLAAPTSSHSYFKKVLGWKDSGIPEDFDDVAIGHWHQNTKMTLGTTVLRIAGTPESHNTYAQERIGVMGRPSQHLQFVHPDRGVTAEYDVYLDD